MNLLVVAALLIVIVGIFLAGGGHPWAWIAIFVILLGGTAYLLTKLARGRGPR